MCVQADDSRSQKSMYMYMILEISFMKFEIKKQKTI